MRVHKLPGLRQASCVCQRQLLRVCKLPGLRHTSCVCQRQLLRVCKLPGLRYPRCSCHRLLLWGQSWLGMAAGLAAGWIRIVGAAPLALQGHAVARSALGP
eukprot:1153690-Pelagomonas_calceolata.AAC.2